ncbi:MAG: DUF2846 domain-containing protein [Telluria sp.]
MKRLSSLVLVTAALGLAGCAASGPKFAEVEASTPAIKADAGRVYFYRNDSMMGAALQPAIRLDGNEVGTSKPGGYFYVDLAPGSHEAATSTEVTNKVSFVLDKGEVKYVRTAPSFGVLVGHVTPTLVSADEAKKELASLSYTGGAAH